MLKTVKTFPLSQLCKSAAIHTGKIFKIKERGPLDGIRICDMSRVLAGPYCTMILGDMGAEVIKIERPGIGDETRTFGPPFRDDQSYYFLSINRNKKSIAVDITTKRGLDIVHQIVKKSDVFLENYLPGKLDSVGLGFKDLSGLNPSLIYCSITGYGNCGPDKLKPGYDLSVSAIGGGLHITGEENGRPNRIGVATTDIMTGMFAHSAIIAALYERLKIGKGKKINVSLLHSQIAMLHSIGTNYLNADIVANRLGTAHPSIAPYQAFHGYDEAMFVVGVTDDRYFKNLGIALNKTEMLHDNRFVDNPSRVQNRKDLEEILQQIFLMEPANYWVELLERFDVPCGMVNTIKETLDNENTRKYIQELRHPVYGNVKVPGPPVDYNGKKCSFEHSPPPRLGENTVDVLKNLLHYPEEDISYLLQQKVIQLCNSNESVEE